MVPRYCNFGEGSAAKMLNMLMALPGRNIRISGRFCSGPGWLFWAGLREFRGSGKVPENVARRFQKGFGQGFLQYSQCYSI